MTHIPQSSPVDELVVTAIPNGTLSLDVLFDGRRVWSIEVQDHTLVPSESCGLSNLHVSWPDALVPYLQGRTHLTVADSKTGVALLENEVAFGPSDRRIRVEDNRGVPVMVNKWGRLGVGIEAMGEETRRLIIERSVRLVEVLEELGFAPFIVGGTLLGAVRDGALLPHDDDADIAYLSECKAPSDVAAEAFRLGHALEARGYELRRHSATHMQLMFRDNEGAIQHYIDVFSAFFTEDGLINQPFHVRGRMRLDEMLPFTTVRLEGVDFPSPADAHRWLTINYDEHWRTPIPGYRLKTAEGTRRRFDAWFGGFNSQREFWDKWYSEADAPACDEIWESGVVWIVAQSPLGDTVLDIGCGSGRLSARLAETNPGKRIIAADFSVPAQQTVTQSAAALNVETAHINLYRLVSLSLPARLGVEGAFSIVGNHVLEQVEHQARPIALRLFRMALRSGGSVHLVCYGAPADEIDNADPTTWHLEPFQLERMAHEYGMSVELTYIDAAAHETNRKPFGAVLTLASGRPPRRDPTMRQRLKRLLLRTGQSNTQAEIETLRDRITELENELDEVRRDSLRVAELIDLAEQTLTPGGGSEKQESPPAP